jgi:multicomponent Na+:H+ antiporter subunit E
MNMRIAATFAIFVATWLLWSGLYQPLLLALGVLSCALVTILALRIGFFDKDIYALHLGPQLPRFWFWLLREIVKANLQVARIILDPRLPISPSIVTIDARSLPEVSQAAFANSITLTPGTVTVDIDRGRIEVHCLTTDAATQLEVGEMLRQAQKLTGA